MWISFSPVFALLISSFLFKNIIFSLTIANFLGALLLTLKENSISLISWILKIKELYLGIIFLDTLKIFAFMFVLSCIIELLIISGFSTGYVSFIKNKIKSTKNMELTILGINFLFFIDDYLAAFSLKAFIKPLLKTYKIAQEKFAYLLNAQFASLCVLIPVSSWGLMLWGQYEIFEKLYPENDFWSPLNLLIKTIPFMLYPICSLVNAWATVIWNKSYQNMKIQESEIQKIDNNIDIENNILKNIELSSEYKEFFKPFFIFFGSLFFQIIYYLLFYSIKNIPLVDFMLQSSILSYIYLRIKLYLYRRVTIKEIWDAHKNGFKSIENSIILLISAWTFASLIQKLEIMNNILPYLENTHIDCFYPIIFFASAFLGVCLLGTSWGTIALLFPIVGSLDIVSLTSFYMIIASVIGGAIAGSHFTPISDAMVISAHSADVSVINYANIQRQYSLSPLIGAVGGILIQQIILQSIGQLYFFVLSVGLFSSIGITLWLTYNK
jgi:tetracycline resistance efflux pump